MQGYKIKYMKYQNNSLIDFEKGKRNSHCSFTVEHIRVYKVSKTFSKVY